MALGSTGVVEAGGDHPRRVLAHFTPPGTADLRIYLAGDLTMAATEEDVIRHGIILTGPHPALPLFD